MELVEGRVEDSEALVEDLQRIGAEYGVAAQAFDARLVAGPDHLRSAVEHAERAIDRGENVADDPAVEILLYAAGRRQIERALEMGVEDGDTAAVVVAGVGGDGDESGAAAAVGDLLAPVEEGAAFDARDEAAIRAFFDITAAETDATAGDLVDLVRERVALLDVEK
ncbi:MAG: KEOPS complex subunit Cgi121 [Halobacteriaceae archaeon]